MAGISQDILEVIYFYSLPPHFCLVDSVIGLTFATLEDLRAAFKAAKDVSDDEMSLAPRRFTKLPAHFPTFIKFANNDDHVVVVMENGEICVWKSEQLLKPDPTGEDRVCQ